MSTATLAAISRTPTEDTMIRMGVVGPGIIWDRGHKHAVRALPDTFQVTAFCSRSEDRRRAAAAEFPGASSRRRGVGTRHRRGSNSKPRGSGSRRGPWRVRAPAPASTFRRGDISRRGADAPIRRAHRFLSTRRVAFVVYLPSAILLRVSDEIADTTIPSLSRSPFFLGSISAQPRPRESQIPLLQPRHGGKVFPPCQREGTVSKSRYARHAGSMSNPRRTKGYIANACKWY